MNKLAILAALATSSAFAITATYGVAQTATATASSGSATITVSNASAFEADQVISIAGVNGFKRIVAVNGNSLTVDSPVDASVSGAAMRIIADGLDHTSVRIWVTTDTPAYFSVWFDVASHSSASQYAYRSQETGRASTVTATTVVGLTPATTYYFRGNLKTNFGVNNASACNSDACGATEFSLTTLADGHSADGRPQQPAEPAPVPDSLRGPVDTTGYRIFPVPAFPDGVVTGSITAGSNKLTVNTVPVGMAVNHWITIEGTKCAPVWFVPAYAQKPPMCQITAINGNVVTLAKTVDTTVSNAAVSWSVYTVYDFMRTGTGYRLGYGTIFEWAQGYKAKWWPVVTGDGGMGLRLPALPPDTNAKCASTPCSLDDPAHRWYVFRTASGPGAVPPPGVRVTPEFAPALGGIVTQYPIKMDGEVVAATYNGANPAHHFRFENMELTMAPVDPNAQDPMPYGSLVYLTGTVSMAPQYVVFDRVYVHPPDLNTRILFDFKWGGDNLSIINSDVRGDYWRPFRRLTQPATLPDGAHIRVPADTYVRNGRTSAAWTSPVAMLTLSGTATAAVNVYGYMRPDGLGVQYTSGAGVTITCDTCASVSPVPSPSAPGQYKYWWHAKVNSGASTFVLDTPLVGDSQWNTEGAIGVYPDNGSSWLFHNNHFEVYGTANWYIDIPTSRTAPPPQDVTITRNHFFWNQDHRVNSNVSNGYFYQVRHNAFESKRLRRLKFEGNIVEGGWARINTGPAVSMSGTAAGDPRPIVSGNFDWTVRYNTFRTLSEPFNCAGHESFNTVTGPDGRRVLFAHNLIYDQNAFAQQHSPANPFIGLQLRLMFGCHDLTFEHNTWYYSLGYMPDLFSVGYYSWSEGFWFHANMWHLNSSGFTGILVDTETDGTLPQSPMMSNTGNWDAQLNTAIVRVNGSIQPDYTFTRNVITCGTSGFNTNDQVDISQAQCNSYQSQFGGLAAKNYFPAGATRASREAAVKWTDPAKGNFRLRYDSAYKSGVKATLDGLDAGADFDALTRARGDITNVAVSNVGGGAATISFRMADPGAECSVGYGQSSDPTTWERSAVDASTSRRRAVTITGLSTGVYSYQVWCAGAPPSETGQFEAR